jgi:hypothetical protein
MSDKKPHAPHRRKRSNRLSRANSSLKKPPVGKYASAAPPPPLLL